MSISESAAYRYELQDPDVRLMLRVRDDDAAAFDELMLRYQHRVVTVLEHLVGNRHQAEDLAQEAFLRVYRARKRYVVGAKFSTWLFTIVNHVAVNALRTRSRRPEVHLNSRESGPMGPNPLDRLAQAASGMMPTRRLDKSELCAVVQAALAGLGERQRMAVLLAKFEEMSYADIGETMEMSPQAVKSLVSRARINLREALEPYLERGVRPGEARSTAPEPLDAEPLDAEPPDSERFASEQLDGTQGEPEPNEPDEVGRPPRLAHGTRDVTGAAGADALPDGDED